MFWNSVPKVPWGGPQSRESSGRAGGRRDGGGGGGGGGGHRATNTRRRHLSPEPYSLGHLRVLFQRLIDAQEGKVKGETVVVETLRAISEVVVYGENQDAKLAARAAAKAQAEQEEEEAAAAAAAATAAAAAAAAAAASAEKKVRETDRLAANGEAGGKAGRRAGSGEGSGDDTRPPAKGAEIHWGEPGGVDGDGGGSDSSSPPVLKGLSTDVRREDAFFELFW
ncbi:unnamed protein product [Pylaiella littoralis]